MRRSAAASAVDRSADHDDHPDDEEADDADRTGVLCDLIADVVGGLGDGGEVEHGCERRRARPWQLVSDRIP